MGKLIKGFSWKMQLGVTKAKQNIAKKNWNSYYKIKFNKKEKFHYSKIPWV